MFTELHSLQMFKVRLLQFCRAEKIFFRITLYHEILSIPYTNINGANHKNNNTKHNLSKTYIRSLLLDDCEIFCTFHFSLLFCILDILLFCLYKKTLLEIYNQSK